MSVVDELRVALAEIDPDLASLIEDIPGRVNEARVPFYVGDHPQARTLFKARAIVARRRGWLPVCFACWRDPCINAMDGCDHEGAL